MIKLSIAAALAAVALSACGGGGNEPPTDNCARPLPAASGPPDTSRVPTTPCRANSY